MKTIGPIAAFAVLTSTVFAQGPYQPRTYEPASPTLSPYLDYFRQNAGVLNNYHTFIRPQQQLQNTINQQNAAIQRNARRLGTLNLDVTNLKEFRESVISPTGHGATFMNYSHYYPSARAPGQR
jgi:hypothetical protein